MRRAKLLELIAIDMTTAAAAQSRQSLVATLPDAALSCGPTIHHSSSSAIEIMKRAKREHSLTRRELETVMSKFEHLCRAHAAEIETGSPVIH